MNALLHVLKLSDGNPGAAVFLMGLMEPENIPFHLEVMAKIEKCRIKGTNLYVLFSDLCDKDYDKVHQICLSCPDEVLIDACSRQDYSGRGLVAKYID